MANSPNDVSTNDTKEKKPGATEATNLQQTPGEAMDETQLGSISAGAGAGARDAVTGFITTPPPTNPEIFTATAAPTPTDVANFDTEITRYTSDRKNSRP